MSLLSLSTLLMPGLSLAPASAADTNVGTINKQLDETQGGGFTAPNTFATGALVRYRLTASCNSLTDPCGIGTVTDVLDPNLEFVEVIKPTTTLPIATSYASGTRTVTITIGDAAHAWQDGTTLEFVVVARVRSTATGTIPNQSTISTVNGPTSNSPIVNIQVPPPTPDWTLRKTLLTGSPTLDEEVKFHLRFWEPDMFGNLDITGGTLVDTYPAGATIVNADGGVVDTVNHTITWTLPAITSSTLVSCDGANGTNCWSYYQRTITMIFPSATFAGVSSVTNNAQANLVYSDGSQAVVRASADVGFSAPVIADTLYKTGPATVPVGGKISWRLIDGNYSNQTLKNYVITDTVPTNVTDLRLYFQYDGYTPIYTNGNYSSPAYPAVFEYLDAGGTWQPWFTYASTDRYDYSPYLPAGATAFRSTVATLPAGVYMDYRVEATAPSDPGITVTNCAVRTGQTLAGDPLTTNSPQCVNTVTQPHYSMLGVHKSHTFPDAAVSSVRPGDEFTWTIVTTRQDGDPLTQVDVIDLLPPQFTYLSTTCTASVKAGIWYDYVWHLPAECDSPTVQPTVTTVNTPVAGTTKLLWEDYTIPANEVSNDEMVVIQIRVRVNEGTAVANYTNQALANNSLTDTKCASGSWNWSSEQDVNDLDGDGVTAEPLCTNTDPVQVRQAAIVDLYKWVKGNLDQNVAEATGQPDASCPDWDGYTRYPCVATLSPGAAFDYRIRMVNTGNIDATDYVAYDILPHVGDTGVGQALSGVNRNTDWTPVLTGPVVPAAGFGVPAGANYVVEYNLTYNPCRPELSAPAPQVPWQGACDNTWFTESQISDWSTVKSFRVKMYDGTGWKPADQVVFSVPMRAPMSAPTSTESPLDLSVAWNSAAHQMSRLNADGSTALLPAAEPRKVGVIVPFVLPDMVSIGDFVWIDADRDGVQDAGETPVEGVLVTLKDKDGNVVATTHTNAAGFYSFINLSISTDYTLTFEPPAGYSITGQDLGGDDGTDSDADPATGVVALTTPDTGGDNLVDAPDVPTYDVGLVKYNLKLKKVLSTAGPFVPGQEVTFTLTPSNDGPSAALPGWSVTDLLPSGLTLVSMSGSGYDCVSNVCTAQAGLAAGASGGPIQVKATINATASGVQHNVAYVAPSGSDVTETVPLGTPPNNGTDTEGTTTDNDAQAELKIDVVSIGDYVWWDTNRDGLQSSGELPVSGVTVKLFDAQGVKVGETTTDGAGYYYFAGVDDA